MKINSEKGFTGVEIAIAVVLIFIFVSIIAMLNYNFNSKSKEIELKAKATEIAINEIEDVKNKGFAEFDGMNKASTQDKHGNDLANQPTGEEGFYRTILVEDYTDMDGNASKTSNLVKKVTVQISYMYKSEVQTIELSIILSKENEI